MPPTLADRLRHILEAAADIEELLAGRDFPSFESDRLLRLAVERALEILSEASRHIPDEIKAREADIAWRRLADLGNRLRHAYHRVDPVILWNIAAQDLPMLRDRIHVILQADRS